MKAIFSDPFGDTRTLVIPGPPTGRVVLPTAPARVEWTPDHIPYPETPTFGQKTYRLVKVDGDTAYYDEEL